MVEKKPFWITYAVYTALLLVAFIFIIRYVRRIDSWGAGGILAILLIFSVICYVMLASITAGWCNYSLHKDTKHSFLKPFFQMFVLTIATPFVIWFIGAIIQQGINRWSGYNLSPDEIIIRIADMRRQCEERGMVFNADECRAIYPGNTDSTTGCGLCACVYNLQCPQNGIDLDAAIKLDAANCYNAGRIWCGELKRCDAAESGASCGVRTPFPDSGKCPQGYEYIMDDMPCRLSYIEKASYRAYYRNRETGQYWMLTGAIPELDGWELMESDARNCYDTGRVWCNELKRCDHKGLHACGIETPFPDSGKKCPQGYQYINDHQPCHFSYIPNSPEGNAPRGHYWNKETGQYFPVTGAVPALDGWEFIEIE